jgi:homeobox domain-containing protein
VFQIQQYVKELNSLESRRGRKPLDINNVVYWFKNARAAQKRAELRGVGSGEFRRLDVASPLDGDFKRHWPSSLLSAGYLLVMTVQP